MSYRYELKHEVLRTHNMNEKKFIVCETSSDYPLNVPASHSVDFVVSQKNESNFSGTYLERMYKWLESFHPELIL
jgi:hypothetical protein